MSDDNNKNYRNSEQDRRLGEMEKHLGVLNSEVGEVKVEMTEIKGDTRWLKLEFIKMREMLDEVNVKINKRPSWLVASIFSILCSTLIGLTVYIITN